MLWVFPRRSPVRIIEHKSAGAPCAFKAVSRSEDLLELGDQVSEQERQETEIEHAEDHGIREGEPKSIAEISGILQAQRIFVQNALGLSETFSRPDHRTQIRGGAMCVQGGLPI